jgi:hypothetical protein
MQTSEAVRAKSVAMSIATSLGRPCDDAVVLHDSNKLTLRLLPCDLVARIAPADQQNARFEVDLARRLVAAGGPVAVPLPSVYARDGFVITFWAYHEPAPPRGPAEYAGALARLHAGMRTVDLPTPHYTDRVASARRLLADRDLTPDLPDADRDLLVDTLRIPTGGTEQLLHGEPHPGNVLSTNDGLLFIDLETCCRGPVEFDLAHAPDEVAGYYPGVDHDLLRRCRRLMLAMITTWRWDRDDQFPDGRRRAEEWISELRRPPGSDRSRALLTDLGGFAGP